MNAFFDYVIKYIHLLRVSDFIDILIVAVILYYLINLIRETRAMQLVKGILLLFAVFFISQWLNLNALKYILGGAMQIGDFATADSGEETQRVIESISIAASDMAQSRTGALIAIERTTRLGEFINTGTMLDANVSSGLLENIFVPNTPLHDGAVIIRNNKIVTAGCLLPLTANNNLSRDLGTRHRAAIGLTELTDAVVIVVSEETGKISLALNGSLTRNLSKESLMKALAKILSQHAETPQKKEKFRFWRSK